MENSEKNKEKLYVTYAKHIIILWTIVTIIVTIINCSIIIFVSRRTRENIKDANDSFIIELSPLVLAIDNQLDKSYKNSNINNYEETLRIIEEYSGDADTALKYQIHTQFINCNIKGYNKNYAINWGGDKIEIVKKYNKILDMLTNKYPTYKIIFENSRKKILADGYIYIYLPGEIANSFDMLLNTDCLFHEQYGKSGLDPESDSMHVNSHNEEVLRYREKYEKEFGKKVLENIL